MRAGRRDYDWRTRLDRAFTQRIYLLDVAGDGTTIGDEGNADYHFNVMGNSGEAYDIKLGKESVECSCPDHTTRGNFCKHLMFVLIRALSISEQEIFEQYYAQNSFATTQNTVDRAVLFLARRAQGIADASFQPNPVVEAVAAAAPAPNKKQKTVVVAAPDVVRRPYKAEDCPICCEPFASMCECF